MVNDRLMQLERAFLDPEGLPGQPAQKWVNLWTNDSRNLFIRHTFNKPSSWTVTTSFISKTVKFAIFLSFNKVNSQFQFCLLNFSGEKKV